MSSALRKDCYASLTHPSFKDAINRNNLSALKLALLVAEFAQQMAAAHEHFSKEIQSVISTFRRKDYEFVKERPVDSPSTIYNAWETLLQETELDAQAHLDAASLLIKNVYKPLEEVATHKQSQAQRLNGFRDHFDSMLQKVTNQLEWAEKEYHDAYSYYQNCNSPVSRESAKTDFYNAHNSYVFQIRASNRTIDEFQIVIPQVLEELEEIYIDTSNTINVAIESHALLLLTKANEQHKRFEDLLKTCRQVNPQLDISYYVNSLNPECANLELTQHSFHPADMAIINSEESMKNQLICDRFTESALHEKKCLLQKEASELTSYIKQNQDITHTLVNICQRMPTHDTQRPDKKSSSKSVESSSPTGTKPKDKKNVLRDDGEGSSRFNLQRQLSVTKDNTNDQEKKLRKQVYKQESKDSGIVTEMYTRPKDFSRSDSKGAIKDFPRQDSKSGANKEKKEKDIKRSDSSKSTKSKSKKSDEGSVAKRSSSVKQSRSGSTKSRSSSLKKSGSSTSDLKERAALDEGEVEVLERILETESDLHNSNSTAPKNPRIDLLTPKQNGSVEDLEGGKSAASIKGMWKKAFKNLKSTSEQKLTKKASFVKKKQSSNEEEPEPVATGEIDPVYSLLKCAADLPKGGAGKMCTVHTHCSGHHGSLRHVSPSGGGDSSGNTSKTSSPSSSGMHELVAQSLGTSHSPKGRRKKLNARMKSFSLDTPEPPKHLLGIDEITKKKSSSFTNTCFGGSSSPDDKGTVSAASLRKKFAASNKTTSLDIEDKKRGSFVPSPKESPKPQKKNQSSTPQYVVLYNFRGKEKDDMDLRAGWRLTVTDSSDDDWWKGKCNGKVGYFPAKYVIPLSSGQRVFQVTHPMHLTEGGNGMKLHKDQIVLQVGEETEDRMILVKAANNKQALCPMKYLNEV